jgi:hypothetical protein
MRPPSAPMFWALMDRWRVSDNEALELVSYDSKAAIARISVHRLCRLWSRCSTDASGVLRRRGSDRNWRDRKCADPVVALV